MSKPRLVFLAPYFPPAAYGGVVQVYLQLLPALHEFDVTVIADRHGSSLADQRAWDAQAERSYGFRVERIDAYELHLQTAAAGSRVARAASIARQTAGFLVSGRRSFRALLDRLRPDLVACGGTYSAGWLVDTLAPSLPLVNYLHGEELTMQTRPAVLRPYMRSHQMRAIRRARVNIAVSRYCRDLAVRLSRAPAERMHLLPNFVDGTRFYPRPHRAQLRAQYGWGDELVLLSLARMEPRKGLDQALRAVAQLHHGGRLPARWRYVLGGAGRDRAALEALARELSIGEFVSFPGFVPDEEVAALYSAADIFLQPNREVAGDTEGFGIVFLEANACGLPVIAGVAGGTGDAVEHGVTGLRVDGNSVSAIGGAIERLASDPALRHAMGAAGAARAAHEFSLPAAQARFRALLHGALAPPASAATPAVSQHPLAP